MHSTFSVISDTIVEAKVAALSGPVDANNKKQQGKQVQQVQPPLNTSSSEEDSNGGIVHAQYAAGSRSVWVQAAMGALRQQCLL